MIGKVYGHVMSLRLSVDQYLLFTMEIFSFCNLCCSSVRHVAQEDEAS